METDAVQHPAASLSVSLRPRLFAGRDEVLAAIGQPAICTLNAMRRPLFTGENALHGRPGRVPGSVNVPAPDLLQSDSFRFRSPEHAAQVFASVGAEPAKRIINYCVGGIAATLDAFLLYQLGYADVGVYDNSMSEWAADPDLPIEKD